MLEAVLAGDADSTGALLDAHPQLCNLADRCPDRRSVLQHAAGSGDLAIVELLLAAGASVDRRSHDGSTALYEASAGGHLGVVRLLVESGADPSVRTNSGRGAWAAAERHGHREVAEYLRSLRVNR
jgi:ankyrin repeat protein